VGGEAFVHDSLELKEKEVGDEIKGQLEKILCVESENQTQTFPA